MASVSFLVRSEKRQKEVTIWLRYRNGRAVDVKVSTTEQIPGEYWDHDRGLIKKGIEVPDERTKHRLESIEARLENIRSLVLEVGRTNKVVTPDLLRESILDYLNKQKKEATKVPSGIYEYIHYLIPLMERGDIRHKGERYDKNTIKVWKGFTHVLRRFLDYYQDGHNGEKLTWEGINKRVCDSFLTYLQSEGYMRTSINKYVTNFKSLVNMALEDEIHTNFAAPKAFYKPKVAEHEKGRRIYLSEAEVQALFEMDLPSGSLHDKVRDVFLCGCYTAQRVSDYGHLSGENFSQTARGVKVVRLIQQKTNTSVTIPILNNNLIQIVKKYDGNVPQIHEQIINREIKLILKKLSETVPSLAEREQTVLSLREQRLEQGGKVVFEKDRRGNVVKPRYELVSTHTARRTAITNLYLTGLFDTFQMMHVSGHKTNQSFIEYIRLSSDEIAETITKALEKRAVQVEF